MTLKVADTVRGTWALPKWENVSVGRLPAAGLRIEDSWVPARLCRFMPYELGWLVQVGRARVEVQNKYLGRVVFPARSVVALQPGRSRLLFPELDDYCMLGVVIGAGEAEGLPVLEDGDDLGVEPRRRTAYAVDRIEMPDSHRAILAVAFQHLMVRAESPGNIALAAAQRLGKSEQAVKNVMASTRKKVNNERWLNLQTTDQLGHYLVRLTRNVTWEDVPVPLRDEGLPR
ncbi:hypothetical protein [uncultured Nocardioides sp.]|uniref:hypothetical protein n=1 Tax=uncultured Nocardioides sp. TaxID=198441 RepID=UPI00260512DA|nr:hypothetical protein [uncultured Nocardioides sp.]